jgi:membrane-bound lytic murein transglycosylase C
MSNKFFISLLISSMLFAQSASEFKNAQMQGFKDAKNAFGSYKKSVDDEFETYQKNLQKAYNEYVKDIGVYWEEPLMSTQKKWVAYSKDKKTRTNVDFEEEKITLQTIASSKEEAKQKLQDALLHVITADTKKAHESDPLEQKLSEVKKPSGVIESEIKPEPILSSVIFEKEPTKENLITYVDENTQDENIQAEDLNKLKNAKIYTLNLSLPDDTMLKRSKIYYEEVKAQSQKQNIPLSLVFAIIHSESSFNPRARSHVPAYGLMQIVPITAGIDTYHFLYKEKKLVSGSYLYDSKNNITMGSAYLHILYYRYLNQIEDPLSRLYCTIAAYNTGAGNVAWAFVKTNDTKSAARIINTMTPEQVYDTLLRDLKYDEPKAYLKKVTQRVSSYRKVYQ